MSKILLGLSGGIDSAVSAAILKEQGFEPVGCFLLFTEDASANSLEAENAKKVADKLGIELAIEDYREHFKKNVTDYFINEYLSGRTPNPCIACNPSSKFHCLIATADKYGIESIATGHYAITEYNEKYNSKILKCSPSKKDQSYFLYRLSAQQIQKTVFPLGNFLSKEEVRAYGEKLNLPNSKKPDSQEICFIKDNNYVKYICEHSDFVPKKGNFIDNDGNVIGIHNGIINYTVGQRKGLGAFGEPRYVKSINVHDNTVTLCKQDERFAYELTAENISWTVDEKFTGSFEAKVKVRSTAQPTDAVVNVDNNRIFVQFKDKVLAPTPGQSAVIYKDNVVVGGGIIL